MTQLPPFADYAKNTLIAETSQFFNKHGLRLIKHTLPLALPDGFDDLHHIAALGKEMPPYTSVYRHMCNLQQRILLNWSYIETDANSSSHHRNLDIPFNLRPLTPQILEQLRQLANDLNDPEFSGILLTLHTAKFTQAGFPDNQCLSKVVGGALVEGLVTNDRCIKALWMHPQLSARSSRMILEAFLPRVVVEAFDIEVEASAEATPYKFVYAMHDDLDRWPRQAWLLLASSKRMAFRRHYEPSTSLEFPVELAFTAHTDEGVNSDGTTGCQCTVEKTKKSLKAQSWLERLIGCTEQRMCHLIPSANECKSLMINRSSKGWKDLFIHETSDKLKRDIERLTPGSANNCDSPTDSTPYSVDEWCDLHKEDLVDISSDSEVHISPQTANTQKSYGRGKRRKLELRNGIRTKT